MFSLGNNIKAKLALAAVVVAGAAIVPSSASAATASGCLTGADCNFVGGTGHNAATNTGGATQFRVNTSPFATVTCGNSRATAVTNSPANANVAVTLQFSNCTALGGLAATVACTPSNVTLTSGGAGSGLGTLTLSANNCTINVAGGLCVIRTSNTVGGQGIPVGATGATGAKTAQITAAVAGTSALTFSSSGGGCALGGVPATGTATFSNDPNSGAITYDEVPSNSNGLIIS